MSKADYQIFFRDYGEYMLFGFTACVLILRPNATLTSKLLLIMMIICVATIFLLTPFELSLNRVALVMSELVFCGVTLYLLLSEWLVDGGLAKWLTLKRGEHWPKEIDYIYLSVGCLGIVAALNRVDFLAGRIQSADLPALFAFTIAIVLRFIKTTAEIKGWNQLPPTSN